MPLIKMLYYIYVGINDLITLKDSKKATTKMNIL